MNTANQKRNTIVTLLLRSYIEHNNGIIYTVHGTFVPVLIIHLESKINTTVELPVCAHKVLNENCEMFCV